MESNNSHFPLKGKKKKNVKVSYSVGDLIAKAEKALDSMNPELAEKFYMKALELEPNNTHLMDNLSSLLLDMDEWDRAKKLLETSIKVEPEGHYSKYMNYGQLQQGKDALQFFQKGVQLMIRNKEEKQHNITKEELKELNQQIASAYCNIAEIFLTDACFEENAEYECGRALELAMQYDNQNSEVYSTLASYKISQQLPEEATKILNQGYDLWKDLEFEERPSYEFRHNTAKLFLELDQPRIAAEIWEGLLEEDDNIAEVYYHLGLAYRKFNTNLCKENLEKAAMLLKKCGDLPFLKEVQEVIQDTQNENIIDDQEIEEKESKENINDDDDDDESDNATGMDIVGK